VDPEDFTETVWAGAFELAAKPDIATRIAEKAKRLAADEAVHPLARYRQAELARMRAIFDDPRSEYHELRGAFVRKVVPDRTPEHLRTAAQLAA
jgi:putative two-component system hydrogenase maturation factor HypX/HoxX